MPKCHWTAARRSAPRTQLDWIANLLLFYPFRCLLLSSFLPVSRSVDLTAWERLCVRLTHNFQDSRIRTPGRQMLVVQVLPEGFKTATINRSALLHVRSRVRPGTALNSSGVH